MNRELYDRYRKLNEPSREGLKRRLRSSPVALRLIAFLEQCGNPAFRNPEVVRFVYGQEEGGRKYSVLENRYFKLRKKFLDEYLSPHADAAELLSPEEKDLAYCRKLVTEGKKEQAYALLQDLDKKCTQKNIFELMPSVLDMMIFCNQSFNRSDRNEALFPRLEEAISLQSAMAECSMLARRVYELNIKGGIKSTRRELARIKDIAGQRSSWPRFSMCYHHISLYYKLSSSDYLDEREAVSHHFTSFRDLVAAHGALPLLIYRPGYEAHQDFHFQQIAALFHYTRCEFREACDAYEHMNEIVTREGSPLAIYRTEAFYFNLVAARLVAERYREAWKGVEEYGEFLAWNGQKEKMHYVFALQALVWCEAYPVIRLDDVSYLLRKIKEYIRKAARSGAGNEPGEAFVTLSKMHFLMGETDLACRALAHDEAKEYLGQLELNEAFRILYKREGDLKKLLDSVKDRKFTCSNPTGMLHLRWLEKRLTEAVQ